MTDHSELILQVLRKTFALSLTFSFEKGLVATFFQQWKEYFYAGVEAVINTMLSLWPSQPGNWQVACIFFKSCPQAGQYTTGTKPPK